MQKSASKRDRIYKYYHRQLCRCSVILFALTGVFLGGCGDFDSGYYFVSSGDLVGAAGGESTVAFRLMREEILFISSTVEDNEVVVDLEGAPLRAAVTDDDGYGSVNVKLPENAGKYDLTLSFQDKRGLNVSQKLNCWVYDLSKPLVMVDANAALAEPETYAAKLNELLACGVQICYEFTCSTMNEYDSRKIQAALADKKLPEANVSPNIFEMDAAPPVSYLLDKYELSPEQSEKLDAEGLKYFEPETAK